jgi:ATP-binding cassette subfamily B (MDR/TAP) protein 1
MLGVAFAAQGVSQVGNFFETLTAARVAAFPALQAIYRKPGAAQQIIYKKHKEGDNKEDIKSQNLDEDAEAGNGQEIRAILPEYLIDPSTDKGLKPKNVGGAISFKKVKFSYPTRPNKQVLNEFTLDIPAGKTVALVGPR